MSIARFRMTSSSVIEVSAIIPVCNRPQLVKEAINSVLQGNSLPQELIVVLSPAIIEKGEPENSLAYPDQSAVEETFQGFRDWPIQLRSIACHRLGAAAARNCGIAAARYPWIALLDSDDLWTPEKLERQWSYLRQRPHLKGCHSEEVWIKAGRSLRQPLHLRPRSGRFLKASFSHCLISNSAVVVRKDALEEIGGYDEQFLVCEDFDLWLRYLLRWPMGLVAQPLTIKRSGGWPQLSTGSHSLDAQRVQSICKLVKNWGAELSPAELQAASLACSRKLHILLTGARRHGSLHKLEGLQKLAAATFPALFA